MPHAITWFDRLRIEGTVWALDQRIYDLPRQSRIAKRREVRANLLTAAADVGTSEALRNLGGSQRLAAEYREAEYGEEPRPNWIAAAVFLSTGLLVFTSLMSEATFAFRDGVLAADPNATGTYTWAGIRYLQDTVTVHFANGDARIVGGAWTPLTWILWLVATIAIGKLWRVVALLRKSRTPSPV
jgi:hypothetical protein